MKIKLVALLVTITAACALSYFVYSSRRQTKVIEGIKATEARYQQKATEWKTGSFLGGSADGVTEDGILVEIKCPLTRKIENKVPKHYMPQIQLLLEILDLDVCDFVQYRPGPPDEFMITRVDRDRTWFDTHLATMQKFWDRVLATRENGLCEVETDEKVCEVLGDDAVDVPTQAEDADVSRLSGDVLCEVHSA